MPSAIRRRDGVDRLWRDRVAGDRFRGRGGRLGRGCERPPYDERKRGNARRIPEDRSELLSAAVVAAAARCRAREFGDHGSPGSAVCGRAEDKRDRAVGSNAGPASPGLGRERLAKREGDLQLGKVEPTGGGIARLGGPRVALDIARLATLM